MEILEYSKIPKLNCIFHECRKSFRFLIITSKLGFWEVYFYLAKKFEGVLGDKSKRSRFPDALLETVGHRGAGGRRAGAVSFAKRHEVHFRSRTTSSRYEKVHIWKNNGKGKEELHLATVSLFLLFY